MKGSFHTVARRNDGDRVEASRVRTEMSSSSDLDVERPLRGVHIEVSRRLCFAASADV